MNALWVEPQDWPGLKPNAVHCWLAHLPSQNSLIERASILLSADERERIGKYRLETHRVRSLLTRAILRWLLGAYVHVAPEKLVFNYGAHGKPALAAGGQIHFNTSHSGDYAAFAVTQLGDVGIDIERVRDDLTRREEIAGRFFAPREQEQFRRVTESARTRAFFEIWTRKEAFVKARGDGLFSGLDQFEVSLDEPRVWSVNGDVAQAAQWQMIPLPQVSEYCGAIIVRAPTAVPSFWQWSGRLVPALIGPSMA